MGVSWSEFEADAPELAHAVKARFQSHAHHIVGTLRESGGPRLSGTEVYIGDELRVGVMSDSRKLADLLRDGRAEIHSAPLEEDLAGGDARVSGRLVEDGPVADLDGTYFRMELDRVTLIQVDDDELVVTTWTAADGQKEARRR